MKIIFLLLSIALFAYSATNALEPVRVAIIKTDGVAPFAVSVELNDYTGGSATNILPSTLIGNLTPNTSGVMSFVVEGAAWTAIASANVNSYYIVDVKVDGTLFAQYRLDELMLLQAQTGSGSAMANGAGAFASIGGKTIANNPTDNFIFGDDDFNHTSGAESKFFFNKSNGAFRAGTVGGSYWDEPTNLGDYSFATGMNTTASGIYSIAMGRLSVASGESSISIGRSTHSTGEFALSTGAFSYASGKYSTATGRSTIASGESTTAMGQSSIASGDYSTAAGYNTIASGDYSTAAGYNTIASGDYSTAAGYNTIASGDYSTAAGYNTIANGDYSTVLGYFNDNTVTDELLAIGNGASDATRSNALEVYKNGDVWNSGFIKNKVTTTTDNTQLAAALTSVINHSGTAAITNGDLPNSATAGTFIYLYCSGGATVLGKSIAVGRTATLINIDGTNWSIVE